MSRRIAFLTVIAAAALSVGFAAHAGLTATRKLPSPSHFSARIDNPWLPLRPGTLFIYRGTKDGKPSRDMLTVTHRTASIDGYPCVVVYDKLFLSGILEERTIDWYTQDDRGNVWYFGEATEQLDPHGKVVSTEGSWRTGVNGAVPGIFLPAVPKVGQTGRQEFYKGHAEDHFRVLDVHAHVSVPAVSSKAAVLTEEWTPLEPGVLDHKYYVRGIGNVLEQSVRGPNERNELVSVTKTS
jgi:hypothetical protein